MNSTMKKLRKNILTLSLLSILLASCGNKETEFLNEEVIVEDETKEMNDYEMYVSNEKSSLLKSNLYDDTMVTGLNVKNMSDDSFMKYILIKDHYMVFDSDEYGTLDEFIEDAKDASLGYLTDEEVLNSKIHVVISTCTGLDEKTHLSEKRTIFETPDGDDVKLIMSVDRTFIDDDKNIGVLVRSFSVDGASITYGVYKNGDEFIDIDSVTALNAIREFDIPTGVYTKESLMSILDNEKGKELILD